MVRALWNGAVVAESPRTVMVEGNHYFPPEAVNRDYVADSDSTSVCSWKGTAHYLTLQVDGETNPDAAWYYPEPLPEARRITGHIAFWRGVVVEGEPEDV